MMLGGGDARRQIILLQTYIISLLITPGVALSTPACVLNAGFGLGRLGHHHNMRAILLLETKRMRNFIPLYNDFDVQ